MKFTYIDGFIHGNINKNRKPHSAYIAASIDVQIRVILICYFSGWKQSV